MKRDTRSRSARIREAILAQVEANPDGLRLGEMTAALAIAAGNRTEVYLQARRLTEQGSLTRHGAGYAEGEAHTYTLAG